MEQRYDVELRKCQESQGRIQQMALVLKEKNDKLKDETNRLEKRMAECDALEKQLQQWQKELEDGVTIVSPSREDEDLGLNY